MYGKNIIKNLGGALKRLASTPHSFSRIEANFTPEKTAKSVANYSTKAYKSYEAINLEDVKDKNKKTEKTSLIEKAKNLKPIEAIKDFKIETGQILNGAGSSSYFIPGTRDKSDFKKESGLTLEQFDEILEQEPTNWEHILSLPLRLLPKQFHGLLINYSIMDKNTDVFKQLIFEKGLDVNAGDEEGHEPILFASEMGAKEMAEILLKQGAVPNLEHELLNAYEIAASRGEDMLGNTDGMEILRLLFEYCPPKDEDIIQDVGYRLKCKGTDEMHDLAKELIGEDVFNDIYENT